jgi:fibronectin type 3 domain-containing protein
MGIRLASEFTREHISPEERMWKAVVATAFEDCLNLSGSKAESYRKQDAHDWFMKGGEEFDKVCFLAGLEPLLVSNRYQELFKKHKIRFTELQLKWKQYRENYKVYRVTKTKEQRALIRKNIERIKCKIIQFKKVK